MVNIFKRLFLLVLTVSVLPSVAVNYPVNDDFLWLTVPDHADWNYNVGETARIEITLCKYGMPVDGNITYSIGGDLRPADEKGVLTLKNGRTEFKMKSPVSPGFRDLRLVYTQPDGKESSHHVKIGFSPEKIHPWTKRPSDFEQYWSHEIETASRLPLKVERKLVPEYCSDVMDCYLVKLEVSPEHQSFYGYLTMPRNAAPESCPVVLSPPGAGMRQLSNPLKKQIYAQNGIIRFAFEIHGLGPGISGEDYADITRAFDGAVKGYLFQGVQNRDSYYLNHVYIGLKKVVDFLTSLPEWDGKNVIAQGGSQGGALSLVAAALDDRVTQLVINHPALSDMAADYGDCTSGYPHFSKEMGILTPDCVETLSYYDVVNFAPMVKATTYMTWGYNDNLCPPTTSYAVWNRLKCEKERLVTPINEHWTSAATDRGQVDWIISHLQKAAASR